MNKIPMDIQELINQRSLEIEQQAREVSSRENDVFNNNPREVYKDKNIKRHKDVSRDTCEETDSSCPSDALRPASPKVSAERLEGFVGQEERVSDIAPANTSSRGFTGISVQHAKSKAGIKVFITLQTPQDAEDLTYLELTAELKRHNRLRELKRYDADDCEFADLYVATILDLKSLSPKEGQRLCMGRAHARGIRQEWVANMFVVGSLNNDNVLETIIINYNGEEYEISMNAMLSPAQEKIYHCSGIYGELKKQRIAPRIETMRRKSFV